MKILIAVDDSPHSERAVEFVTRMRWPAGSRVIVASAAVPPIAVTNGPFEAGVAVPAEVLQEAQKHAKTTVDWISGELQSAGFSTETRVLVGDPREALMRLAEEEHADLIVVGSHGRTGLSKLLLGSVSSHVVTHAQCSVLVVKENPAH
jgi:nucleotide-binding universal stress UspA family protein